MEIILLEDVKKVGKKGDIVKVNDGYARNFMIPKKLGVEATKQAKRELESQKKAEAQLRQEELEEAKELGKKIEESSVEVKIKAGEGGKTFGSISTKEITKAAQEQLGLKIDKKKMKLDEPIKSLGVHNIVIKVHPKVTTQLKVKVTEEK
ncbi:LSU ribosomal protein L9P [Natranaerovirga hydrolytica]|uniref:Large ribosomal subunit protein bL9 n=1 Tax=Natranaerovirga hydrolytica TaxID=680378 RepID=A0A4R1N2Q0_9FIRM|nr:50S ribosomal protein L9 [Natranaerovirga hydrolytica]TCK99731.1 LSU ribosomal protein L9P [Natranaerovirga hydrolytica]